MPAKCQAVGIGAAVLTLVFAVQAHAQPSSPSRRTVAILEFDYGAVKVQWPAVQGGRRNQRPLLMPTLDALDVGKGIANLLVSELAASAELRLIERQRLVEVAREGLGADNTRARYLVMGAVTKFGGEQKTRAAGAVASAIIGIGVRRPLLGMGMFKTKDTHAYVDLAYRVVDTTTGEIVGAANAAGKSRRRGLLLGGLGGGGRGTGGGAVSVDSADFQATILGEATVEAVKDAADKLRALLAGIS